MTRHGDRPPTFEFTVGARAREVYFHAVGEPRTYVEGTGKVEIERRREGLPSPARPHVTYKNVRVAKHIRAWLPPPDAD